MRSLFTVIGLGLCLGSIAACGGSTAVNFYGGSAGSEASATGGGASADGAGAAGSLASAGQATSVAGGSGGASVASAGATNAGAGASGAPSDAPCSPVIDGVGGTTGPFGTTGPYCLRVSGPIVGWGCSNFQGRTLKVNGTQVDCSELPLPGQLNGDYYFDVSGGGVTYASMYWY